MWLSDAAFLNLFPYSHPHKLFSWVFKFHSALGTSLLGHEEANPHHLLSTLSFLWALHCDIVEPFLFDDVFPELNYG